MANDLVGQLCEQIENGQWDKLSNSQVAAGGGGDTPDAEVKPAKPSSEMLHGLFKELEAICAFVSEHLTSAEGEERRRYAVAAQAFDRGMQHCPLPVPEPILDANGACKGEVVVVDARADDVISMFKAFADRAPRFTTAMTVAEESFVKTYHDSLGGMGGTGSNNPALEESEKVTPCGFDIYVPWLTPLGVY